MSTKNVFCADMMFLPFEGRCVKLTEGRAVYVDENGNELEAVPTDVLERLVAATEGEPRSRWT